MNEVQRERIIELAQLLRQSSYPIAFTGAGISTESGIPDYRSPSTGAWTKMDPAKISVTALKRDPIQFGQDYLEFVGTLEGKSPNKGQLALAELEKMGFCHNIITQNIDSLHQSAGSQKVLEVHGHTRSCRCDECGTFYPHEDMTCQMKADTIPKSSCCGALLRTNVVLFGDAMADDFQTAWNEASKSDFCLVLGSSMSVYPAAESPFRSKKYGIINRDLTGKEANAALSIQGELGELLEALVLELKEKK